MRQELGTHTTPSGTGFASKLDSYHERHESNRIEEELEGPSVPFPFLSMAGSREKKTRGHVPIQEKSSSMSSLLSKDLLEPSA